MHRRAITSLSFFLVTLSTLLCAQERPLSQVDFASPLRITASLAGNFGELRPNHFHGGIDLKTGGQQGLDILAIEDGYVSRIKISPYGYGKALYIDHPNGYTSVYGHLRGFNEAIDAYIKAEQRKLESFEVDLYPGKGVLPVNREEVVAVSGNTGGSSGPHLHFEVRETSTEVPRNPLHFGFGISDSKKPILEAIAVVPLGANSEVNGRDVAFRSRTSGNTIMAQQPIKTTGTIGIQVRGYDSQDGSYNHNGIYRMELFVDDARVSTFTADSIPFDVSRHLNALIDYPYYYYKKGRYVKMYKDPGNALPNLEYTDDGELALLPGNHVIRIRASDFHGNVKEVTFQIISEDPVNQENTAMIADSLPTLHWDLPYLHESEDFKLFFPKRCVYADVALTINESPGEVPAIEVLHPSIPVQESFVIETPLPAEENGPSGWVIAQINGSGKPFRALATQLIDGWLKAESRSFGRFKAYRDVTAPSIRSVNFSNGKHWSYGKMKFIVKDNFSGVQTIRVEVNGVWTHYDFEPKQDLVTIDVSDVPSNPDRQQFVLEVTDLAGNVATFEGNFFKE